MLKYEDWIKTRKYIAFADFEKEDALILNSDPEEAYVKGCFEYTTGFIEELTDDNLGTDGQRYYVLVERMDKQFHNLHVAEKWLWDNWCRDEINGYIDPATLDSQAG